MDLVLVLERHLDCWRINHFYCLTFFIFPHFRLYFGLKHIPFREFSHFWISRPIPGGSKHSFFQFNLSFFNFLTGSFWVENYPEKNLFSKNQFPLGFLVGVGNLVPREGKKVSRGFTPKEKGIWGNTTYRFGVNLLFFLQLAFWGI